MKLLKSYSFEKLKRIKLSPFHFHLPIFVKQNDSLTRRVGESLKEKRQHRNRLFPHEGHLSPPKFAKKDQNFGLFLRPSIIALYKKIIALLLKR
jgi:hypothetical protein